MKRNKIRRFFQQKQYAIASLILFAAIAAMTGMYVSNRITDERQEQELAQKEQELADADGQENGNTAATDRSKDPFHPTGLPDAQEDVTSVTSIIKPKETTLDGEDGGTQKETDAQKTGQKDTAGKAAGAEKTGQEEQGQVNQEGTGQGQRGQANQEGTGQGQRGQANQEGTGQGQTGQGKQGQEGTKQDTAAQSTAVLLNFSPDSDLSWPLQGDVILNYSMDQTVYFATLDQYKYNPALIIAGKVNDPVNAAATGRITDISANEETGVTVTMDLGNGYSAVYGQLKEVLYKEGATVESGNAIGYVAEPTKYYSVEGSNLYFELLKENEPVDPLQYMQ